MRRVFTVITLILGVCVLAGCSKKSNIDVVLDGKASSFQPTDSAVLTTATSSDAVMHTIVLANYELKKPATKKSLFKSAKGDGKMRVEFSIVGEKGSDETTALREGEYKTNVGNAGSPHGATTDAKFAFSREGREQSRGLNGPDIKEGIVRIDSIKDGVVTGTIHVTDGSLVIQGSFASNIG